MLLDHMTEAEKRIRLAEDREVLEELGLDAPPNTLPSGEEKKPAP